MVFVVVAMALVSSLISVACMLLETSVGLSKDSLMHMGMAVDSVLGLVVLSSVVFIVVATALMSSLISVSSVLLEAGVRLSEDSLVHVRVGIDFILGLVVLRSVVMVFVVVAMALMSSLISIASMLLEAGMRLSENSLVHVGM